MYIYHVHSHSFAQKFSFITIAFIGQLVIFGTFSEWRNFPWALLLLCTTYNIYNTMPKSCSARIFSTWQGKMQKTQKVSTLRAENHNAK